MALSGSQKAYLQARSGIARSAAIRSNYVFPLYGVVTVGGHNVTHAIRYGTLKVTQEINEEPDTASFEAVITDGQTDADLVVGADVVIGLGGATDNALFGGRILTAQTTRGLGHTPSVRSVMCADYLQVLDSEYLVTYDWPPQSASTTIADLVARFTGKDASGVAISPAGIAAGLPSHASIGVINEKFSTVLRRLVTMFPAGGGFYVDPLKVLHVWAGASEPNVVNPSPLTLQNPMVKALAETINGSQQRDAVIVEGLRTTAPLGTPGPDPSDPSGRNLYSIPVADASILDKVTDAGVDREVRIGTQRVVFRTAYGVWSAPVGTPQTTICTVDVPFNPDASVENNTVRIWLESVAFLTGRTDPWIRIDEQYLRASPGTVPSPYVLVPRVGYGAMIGAIKANAVVTAIDSLGNGYVTGRYDAPGSLEQIRPQPIDSDVVMTMRSTTAPAIHEQLVQDGRYARSGAAARGAREIADFKRALISIEFETEDLNARPGRLQAYNLAAVPVGVAPMAGQYMILSAELTWPVWGQPPRRVCYATDVHPADVTDAWVVDTG